MTDTSSTLAVENFASDAALIIGGGRAILLQVANPVVAAGVTKHSTFRQRPIERLRSTLTFAYATVVGTPEQAAFSANKNLVTRAVGVEDSVLLETHQHEVQAGDLYLMCSDGLSDMLDDAGIAQVLQTHDSLETGTRALIDAANDAGGKDNISVILVRASGGASAPVRSWWPFRR